MKLLVLTAIIGAVTADPLVDEQKWPWQVGKVYFYDVHSYTSTKFDKSVSIGTSFKTQLEVAVKAPGKLRTKIVNSQYATFKAQLTGKDVPSDVKYQPVNDFDQTIEIIVDGGRILSLNLPSTITTNEENMLKGLLSALQVDVSTVGYVEGYPNSFDEESFQGQFNKWETDVTGNCKTLYSVSPLSAEWHRELTNISSEVGPVEIIKTKNYESCKNHIEKRNFIDYTSEARFVVDKQGTIFKSEVITSVSANPLLGGNQKCKVYSYVKFFLRSVEQDNDSEWTNLKEYRSVETLIFEADNTLDLFTYGSEQNLAKTQQVLQEITPLLQDPNNLSKNDFLIKFEILVSLLRSLNSEQFHQISSNVEIAKSSENVAKNDMWIIFRDAVAQVGTVEAFEQIKTWVLYKKIENEEAAELITAIGAALSKPNKNLLINFFDFTTRSEVTAQTSVHNAALLAFTKLLRSAGQDQLVIETVSYLSKGLNLAVQDNTTSKAQVYVRVLGNLASPEILKVFAPYLDGTIPVSKYLRIQMVTNLKTLANLKDPYVRSVLFSILRNTAESYEVRVAAALNIFRALPTAEMFQIMAHMTNDDPSTQVRAVLSNGIAFAAELKDPQFRDLAQRAQAVLPKVTKLKYGYSYSTQSIMDGYTGKDEFSFFKELSYIGSENHILPKYLRAALRFRNTGFYDEQQVTLSVSDILDFLSVLKSKERTAALDTEFKFSAKKLNKLLNIKRSSRQPLEGALFFENGNQQKLITFNEQELIRFYNDAFLNLGESFRSFLKYQYTKILFTKTDNVLLPLASGMPFMLQYSQPLAIIAKIQGDTFYGMETRSIEFKIDITIDRNLQGSVGYIDTLAQVFAAGGVTNRVQIRLPTKFTITYNRSDDGGFKFEPLQTEKDENLIHFSVLPFIGTQKRDSVAYDIEIIKRPFTTFNINKIFGENINMLYHLNGYTYSSDFKILDLFKNLFKKHYFDIFDREDIELRDRFNNYHLSNVGNIFYQKDIALTEFNLNYLNKDSTSKAVTFNFYIGSLYNQNSGELGKAAALLINKGADHLKRRLDIASKVTEDIVTPEVKIFEINAKFDDEKKNKCSFISAIAYSYVDPKVKAGIIARGVEDEISAVFQLNRQYTEIVPLNFEEALKHKVNLTYDISIVGNNNKTLLVHGAGWRSDQYAKKLMDDLEGKNCLLDLSQNNFYQTDCHKLIIEAHAPDIYVFELQVENPASIAAFPKLLNTFFKGKLLVPHWFADSMDKNVTILDVKMAYYDNRADYYFSLERGSYLLQSEILSDSAYALAIYEPITPYERTLNLFTGYRAYPFCTIDDNKVKTFSGRSYNYTLTSSWHLVMLDEADYDTNWNDLVILVRRPSVNQEEVYISYYNYHHLFTNYLEITIKPNSVEVKSSGVKTVEGDYTLYLDRNGKKPILEYYDLGEGVQVFQILGTEFRILYDKHRLVIFTDTHRSTTIGICGQSSGQIGDDYLTPWGLVDLPEYYGAAFTLEDDLSDPKTISLKREARLNAYQPVTKYTKILHSNVEWSKVLNKSHAEF